MLLIVFIANMVITNYEAVLRDKITQRIADCYEPMLRAALSSEFFAELVIKLYEYCEELNMIKRKVEKLKFTTGKKYQCHKAAK